MNKADRAREPYPNLIWVLRAFAQPADIQFDLYQSFTGVADDLALDFETAILHMGEEFLESNPDIKVFDELLGKHSGQPEYWTENALRHDPFWEKLRGESGKVLKGRGKTTSPPQPLNITFVQVDDGSHCVMASLMVKLKRLFKR